MAAGALAQAFAARKVAVFGASATPGKYGHIVVEQLLAHGYEGEIVLVNPRGGSAFGLPLRDPGAAAGADLAVATTPPASVPAIAEACGELGIGVLAVESAGFAEVGERELEDELLRRARAGGVRVIGPNCLGLFVAESRLNLTTLPDLPAGGVSFVSQSGGLALQVSRRLRSLGSGFDVLLSLGNKLDLGFADALAAVGARPQTRAVLLYLERLDEGEVLLDVIARWSRELPVLAVVGGRTPPGQEATRSHTGSLLGRWDRVAGVLESAGARVFDSLSLATVAAAGGARGPRMRGRRVFVVADGGGHSVLLADALASAGYELAAPLDFAGAADADPGVYSRTVAEALASGRYDAVVVGGLFGGYGGLFGEHLAEAEVRAAEELGRLAAAHAAPIVVQSTYGLAQTPAIEALRAGGVPCVEWPEEVVAVLAARTDASARAVPRDAEEPRDRGELVRQTERVAAALDEAGIAHALGRPVTRTELPDGPGPWVLRLDGFAHKSAAGAIRVGVAGADLPAAYDELVAVAERAGVEPRIRLAPLVVHRHELLVTFWRHETDGRGFAIGAGGTDVERTADVAAGRMPASEDDVLRQLARTRVGRDLSDALLAPFVLRLARVFDERLGDLRELECNPVALTDDGPVVLDVLPLA